MLQIKGTYYRTGMFRSLAGAGLCLGLAYVSPNDLLRWTLAVTAGALALVSVYRLVMWRLLFSSPCEVADTKGHAPMVRDRVPGDPSTRAE